MTILFTGDLQRRRVPVPTAGRMQAGSALRCPSGYCHRASWMALVDKHLPTSIHILREVAHVYAVPMLETRDLPLREKAAEPSLHHLAYLRCKCPFCGQASLSVHHCMYWCPVTRSVLVLLWDIDGQCHNGRGAALWSP